MKINLGRADRSIRIILAAVVVTLFFTKVITGVLGTVLLIVAGSLVLTSLIGVCPLYIPFKIRTIRKK
ncbi:MAG: DUF2892 domain-containing protein [Bacteroidetes bacterium]|jgi:hypothetical protein|nr:DUF2892 domain-containing protein [Bacteroidota bacterium]MBT3750686.1 DUF2892 domain-containing protein [Bacteroidota bacterium]MBT4401470.1 DUF2892 domain-containing protein [Bacteroidota bacterium]MBT4408408.1 DUF2892 domain-containing protein [Bacteroidota bacterium]MBT5425018.1 DUF2892 domain-containing protein [Bacteroidota bacterium]